MDYGAAILAELQAIRQQNDRLLALLTAGSGIFRRGGMTAAKRERLAELLPAIRSSVGAAVFCVADLQEKALEDAALSAALSAARGSAKSCGNLFAACAGIDVDGLRIERVGAAREGAVWHVVAETAARVSKAPAKSQTRAHR